MSFLHYSVQDTIKMLMLKGLTKEQAIKEVEQRLKMKVPEVVLNTILVDNRIYNTLPMNPESYDRIIDDKGTSQQELIDFIEDVLGEFGHGRCPYCERYIGLSQYVSRNDIECWLNKRGRKTCAIS